MSATNKEAPGASDAEGLDNKSEGEMVSVSKITGGESPFDSIKQVSAAGREFWSARDLMPLMGYARWEDFQTAVERAKIAAANSGMDVEEVFRHAPKNPGQQGGRPQADFELTRFAAYLVALNGDPRKSETAAAQAYFVIKTREAEVRPAFEAPKGPELLAFAVIEAQRMIEARDARIAQLDAKVTEDAPKVAYIDIYVADSDLLKFRTVAASLGVQEEWLRNLLVAKKWIYFETDTRWSNAKGCKETRKRYSAYADKKRYFRPAEVHEAPRFKGEVYHTLKVTPSGAEAIARLVEREQAA